MPAFSFPLRIAEYAGAPLFHLSDVTKAFGILDYKRVISLCEEDEFVDASAITGDLADRGTYYLTEPGVYRVALNFRGRRAGFRRWVLHEVLPALRENGRFSLGRKPDPAADIIGTLREALADGQTT